MSDAERKLLLLIAGHLQGQLAQMGGKQRVSILRPETGSHCDGYATVQRCALISRAELLHNYKRAKLALDRAKADEMAWRLLIATTLFPDPTLGANADGDVILTIKENVTISATREAVSELIAAQPAFASVFDWSYKIGAGKLRELTQEQHQLIAPYITIKPATPDVKIKGFKTSE